MDCNQSCFLATKNIQIRYVVYIKKCVELEGGCQIFDCLDGVCVCGSR